MLTRRRVALGLPVLAVAAVAAAYAVFACRATRARLELVGRLRIRFADFGFGPPRRPIVRIGGNGTIEFRLRFRHAAQ